MKLQFKNQAFQEAATAAVCDVFEGQPYHDPNVYTVYSYVGALKKIFVVEDMPAWCPNLRCKTPVRTTDTGAVSEDSHGAWNLWHRVQRLFLADKTISLLVRSWIIFLTIIYLLWIKKLAIMVDVGPAALL